ncbi:ABC transporter permease [Oerskovia sp. KBS0722]|uniref:ABC transporter permease n=1 Tax=Oerskovia sp. KBS0722 TaxID=1179673 RepID=UPI00110EFCF6|nr:ABC transporter permease [Oerskovia sp. KBS0722]QDW62206.1 ABC transporter permease [Oerskovia sp. KBS0722]
MKFPVERSSGTASRLDALRDVADHSIINLRRAAFRSVAFGLCAAAAAGLLTFAVSDAQAAEASVASDFDALAATRLHVATPVLISPYETLAIEQIEAVRAIEGVESVAWLQGYDAQVDLDLGGGAVSAQLWEVGGDVSVLSLESHSGPVERMDLATWTGQSLASGTELGRFDAFSVNGRSVQLGDVISSSPVVPMLLDGLVAYSPGASLSTRAPGELVVSVRPGWGTHVAPRLAEVVAPGRSDQVFVRFPPEADFLRTSVTASVGTLVLVVSGAILLLGAVTVGIATYLRVGAEKRVLGLYRAIGASNGFVVSSVVLEAAVAGLAGAAFGTLVGAGAASLKSIVTSAPLALSPEVVIVAVASGLVANVVGALGPAFIAVRSTPLEAIRSH